MQQVNDTTIADALTIGNACLPSNPTEALRYARWVLKHDPHNLPAHTLRYKALLAQNKFTEAARVVEEVIGCLTKEAAKELAAAHNNKMPPHITAAQYLLLSLASEEEVVLKESLIQKAITLRPDWYLPYLHAGKQLHNASYFYQALSLAPDYAFPDCLQEICRMLYAQGKTNEVKVLLEQARLIPDFPELIVQEVIYHLRTEPEKAFPVLERRIEGLNTNQRFFVFISLYEQTVKLSNSSLVWEYLAKETPYWGTPLTYLASYYTYHHQTEQACKILKRLVAMKPERWEYKVQLACASNKESDFLLALNAAPDYEPTVIAAYGQFLINQERYSAAIDLLMPAVEYNPTDDRLARLLITAGQLACQQIL